MTPELLQRMARWLAFLESKLSVLYPDIANARMPLKSQAEIVLELSRLEKPLNPGQMLGIAMVQKLVETQVPNWQDRDPDPLGQLREIVGDSWKGVDPDMFVRELRRDDLEARDE